jgi:hypothetical protein
MEGKGHPMKTSLVGGDLTILKNMKVNGKDDNPYIMENQTCSKPPTSVNICKSQCVVFHG